MQGRWQKTHTNSKPLRVGFVPLCDCAPLVMAQELELFEKHGLRVHLSREAGWATIRDKIIYGELDAAHALAPMVFAANLGLGSVRAECLTSFVLTLEGNAITVARSLSGGAAWDEDALQSALRSRGGPLTFGIPFRYSSHHFLLRLWLRRQGLSPERDVQFVVVPPPQMAANLKAGHLDGYCVGEPWNMLAARAGFGWRVATSAEIAPLHPEKVLMVRREFAVARAEEHERLIAALLEACRFCAAPANRERIIETLGEARYVNAPAAALSGSFEGRTPVTGSAAHEPSLEKAFWVIDHLTECGLLPDSELSRSTLATRVFRADIFQNANKPNPKHETTRHELCYAN